MIEYPPDFPDAAIAYVERTIADAEGEFHEGPCYSPDDEHRPAVFFALKVFEAFLWQARAVAVEQHWTATRLREVVSACLERLIVSVFREKHPQRFNPAPEPFRAAVYRELRRFSFWTQDYQDTLRELSGQDPLPLDHRAAAVAEVRTPAATATMTETDLIATRAKMLADYKRAAGVTADKQIYEHPGAGIHKPEFYKWRNGKLPATSATAINFERFLAPGVPPVVK